MEACQETRQPTEQPRKPRDGEKTEQEAPDLMNRKSSTHSKQHSTPGFTERHIRDGSGTGKQNPKDAQHSDTLLDQRLRLQLHDQRSKRHSAILTQLRTEKIGLKDPLFKLKVPEIIDPECECGEGNQTVQHILLCCRKHRNARIQELGQYPGRTNLRKVLNERKVVTKAIKFIERIGILKQFRTPQPADELNAGGRL